MLMQRPEAYHSRTGDPSRNIEVNVISCRAVHSNTNIFGPINTSVCVFWDYDPEYEGTKFNRFKKGILLAGETTKKIATSTVKELGVQILLKWRLMTILSCVNWR